MTLSTSLANMQPLSKEAEFNSKYCGALLSPASTHGKNVYPNCCGGDRVNYDKCQWTKDEKGQACIPVHI